MLFCSYFDQYLPFFNWNLVPKPIDIKRFCLNGWNKYSFYGVENKCVNIYIGIFDSLIKYLFDSLVYNDAFEKFEGVS